MQNEMTKRAVVKGTAVIGAATAAGSFMPGTASAASKATTKKLPTSANGWPIEREARHVSTVWSRPVAGRGLDVEVRIGDVEAILVHVIRRFHYEVQKVPRVDLAR
ncbi:hypothetical protein [Streptomyces sclerotialus]|uniref:hypothetical protein n=1 Tax=Streptomyces sclerotialus TaxID=1957 RepID=UPI000AFEE865